MQQPEQDGERHWIWARLIKDLNNGRITEKISLLLRDTLVSRNKVIMWQLYTLKDMNDRKHPYEAPEALAIVVTMEGGILQSSLDANREDYGKAIPLEW